MHKGVLLEDGMARFSDIQFFSQEKGQTSGITWLLWKEEIVKLDAFWESQV